MLDCVREKRVYCVSNKHSFIHIVLSLIPGKYTLKAPSHPEGIKLKLIYFTITAEIHARSLVNFYGQYADRQMNLKFMRQVRERELEIRQVILSVTSTVKTENCNVCEN